jgi:hypothetical protein
VKERRLDDDLVARRLERALALRMRLFDAVVTDGARARARRAGAAVPAGAGAAACWAAPRLSRAAHPQPGLQGPRQALVEGSAAVA